MTVLWIINAVVWSALFLFVLPGAWSAAKGTAPRYGDPIRLAVLATALMMDGFALRWLFAPQSQFLWQILYLLSAIDAIYIAILCHAYGRGPQV
jgi:hypothetical protein